jgi:hypothetical protein
MATSFDLGGLLGSAFGGDEYGDLLTPAQQSAIQQRALLSAASALLQAGAPSTTRTSLGQALGAALTAGQTGAERAQQSALTGMLTRQKLEEARREQEAAESFRQFLTGGGAGGAEAGAVTPAQALALPGMAAGPTVARAEMIGQPMPQAMAATGQPTQSVLQNLSPEQRTLLSRLKPTQGIQELMRISAQASEFGEAKPEVVNGRPAMVQYNKLGQRRVVEGTPMSAIEFGEARPEVVNGELVMVQYNKQGERRIVKDVMPASAAEWSEPKAEVRDGKTVMVQYNKAGQSRVTGSLPYEAPPVDIRAAEYISGQSLAGTGPSGMATVGQYRRQAAPVTNVDVRMPGTQQFLGGVGTDIAQTLGNLTSQARAANETLATIERIRPALGSAVTGPAAEYRTTMLRIGQQLGVAGQNEAERLSNTRTLVQGLAQLELEAAAGMRGQGALTEGERAILRRAAAGDQTLSAPELTSAMNAAEKVANRRIATQQQYLEQARQIPGFQQFAPLYQVTPPQGAGGGRGGAPSMTNAIEAEILRRQQAQQPRGR